MSGLITAVVVFGFPVLVFRYTDNYRLIKIFITNFVLFWVIVKMPNFIAWVPDELANWLFYSMVFMIVLGPIYFQHEACRRVESDCLRKKVEATSMVKLKLKSLLLGVWHPAVWISILFVLLKKPRAYEYQLDALKNPKMKSKKQERRKKEDKDGYHRINPVTGLIMHDQFQDIGGNFWMEPEDLEASDNQMQL